MLIPLLAFGVIYVWRQVHPNSFEALKAVHPALQNLPSVLLGALMAAAPDTDKEMVHIVIQTLIGAFAGGSSSVLSNKRPYTIFMVPQYTAGGCDVSELKLGTTFL